MNTPDNDAPALPKPIPIVGEAGRHAVKWGLGYTADQLREAIAADRAARALPDGWVMVPREITPEMIEAWLASRTFKEGYAAMIAASPTPVAADQAVAAPEASRQGEAVGKIVLFGGDLKEVSWHGGKMPSAGTKLYAAPSVLPAQEVAGVPNSWHAIVLDTLMDFRLWHWEGDDGEALPLVDYLCPPRAKDISAGRGQLDALAGDILTALEASLAASPAPQDNATPAPAVQVPAEGSELLRRFERAVKVCTQHHTEYQGKVMPDRTYEVFARLRDETIPKLRAELQAALAAPAPAASAQPQAPQGEAVGWLFEYDGTIADMPCGGTMWACIKPPAITWGKPEVGWTKDANAALRFARREDAEAFRAGYLGSYPREWDVRAYTVTEHMWLDAPPPSATPQAAPQADREELLGDAIRALIRGEVTCSDELPEDRRPVHVSARRAFGAVRDLLQAAPQATAASAQALGEAGEVKPRWIVNDLGELGVEVAGRFFFLYKGDNIEYGSDPDCVKDGIAQHDAGGPMRYRIVGKREFGEVQWPAEWLRRGYRDDRYTQELAFHPGLSFGKPEDGQWRDLPAAPQQEKQK